MNDFRHRAWEAFGASLSEVRKQRGLTQEELADRLKVFWPGSSQSALAKMERGERMIGVDHVAALTWILGVEAERLVPHVTDRHPETVDLFALNARRGELLQQRRAWEQEWEKLERELSSASPKVPKRFLFIEVGGGDVEPHEEA